MSFGQAISYCFKNYANFNGRASRSQFWWFYLFYVIVYAITLILDRLIIGSSTPWITIIVVLAMFVPIIAAGCRRMHDTGRSGWLQLLGLIPCAGYIILIIFFAQPSQPTPNPYGESAV